MWGMRALVGWGVFLALPMLALAQAEPEPTPLPAAEVGDQTTPTTTRTVEAGGVAAPFDGVSVDDPAPLVDEAAPPAPPASHEKLPPGPFSHWP